MNEVNLTQSLQKAKKVTKYLSDTYGVNISSCYQCGKCAAGCPLASKMDYNSREIINLLKLGLFDEAIHAKSVWYCAGCDLCSTRCPQNVDPAGVMEAIHLEAKKRNIISEPPVDVFHTQFLDCVRKYGRTHEMSLMIKYNLCTGKLFKDAPYAPRMLRRRKLALTPHKIQGRDEIKQIFQRCRELQEVNKV